MKISIYARERIAASSWPTSRAKFTRRVMANVAIGYCSYTTRGRYTVVTWSAVSHSSSSGVSTVTASRRGMERGWREGGGGVFALAKRRRGKGGTRRLSNARCDDHRKCSLPSLPLPFPLPSSHFFCPGRQLTLSRDQSCNNFATPGYSRDII